MPQRYKKAEEASKVWSLAGKKAMAHVDISLPLAFTKKEKNFQKEVESKAKVIYA